MKNAFPSQFQSLGNDQVEPCDETKSPSYDQFHIKINYGDSLIALVLPLDYWLPKINLYGSSLWNDARDEDRGHRNLG